MYKDNDNYYNKGRVIRIKKQKTKTKNKKKKNKNKKVKIVLKTRQQNSRHPTCIPYTYIQTYIWIHSKYIHTAQLYKKCHSDNWNDTINIL